VFLYLLLDIRYLMPLVAATGTGRSAYYFE
jgi:hypothetical protein